MTKTTYTPQEGSIAYRVIYSLGKGSPTIRGNAARHPSAKPDALDRGAVLGQKRTRIYKAKPVPVDIDAIKLLDDVPLPAKPNAQAKWLELFKRMKAGQSCQLPAHTRGSLNKYIQTAKTDGLGTFIIRSIDTETIGLWRTA